VFASSSLTNRSLPYSLSAALADVEPDLTVVGTLGSTCCCCTGFGLTGAAGLAEKKLDIDFCFLSADCCELPTADERGVPIVLDVQIGTAVGCSVFNPRSRGVASLIGV
jgi:hypothetical protein